MNTFSFAGFACVCVRACTSAGEILQPEMKGHLPLKRGPYHSSTLLYILLETTISSFFFVILKIYLETRFCFIYTFYSPFSGWHDVAFHCLAAHCLCFSDSLPWWCVFSSPPLILHVCVWHVCARVWVVASFHGFGCEELQAGPWGQVTHFILP